MTLVEQIRAGKADDELSAIVVAVYDRQKEIVIAGTDILDPAPGPWGGMARRDAVLSEEDDLAHTFSAGREVGLV